MTEPNRTSDVVARGPTSMTSTCGSNAADAANGLPEDA